MLRSEQRRPVGVALSVGCFLTEQGGVLASLPPCLSSPNPAEDARLAGELVPPDDLEVQSFVIGSDEYVVLTFRVAPDHAAIGITEGLTASERVIAELVLQGQSNAEIARTRGTSVRTIANQIAAIYRKLGVGSRRELFARWRSQPSST